MTDETTMVMNIPFSGFYESKWSGGIDHEEESHAEYEANEREEGEQSHPAELRLSETEIAEILFDVTDYSAAYATIARDYVEAFGTVMGEALDLDLKLTFESMSSPKYYNFETDRIFVNVPLEVVKELFKRSEKDGHKALKQVVHDRHTSRSGFCSWYSNDLADWLEKPVEEWDHNELMTLLGAAFALAEVDNGDELEWEVYEAVAYGEGFYHAWSNAVDWAACEERVAELRAEKLEAIHEDDPDFVMPEPRCPYTLELPL
jgi:hypothetical protein